MIVKSVARAAATVARDAARVVTAVGSHAVWWLDYRSSGRSRRAAQDDRGQ